MRLSACERIEINAEAESSTELRKVQNRFDHSAWFDGRFPYDHDSSTTEHHNMESGRMNNRHEIHGFELQPDARIKTTEITEWQFPNQEYQMELPAKPAAPIWSN